MPYFKPAILLSATFYQIPGSEWGVSAGKSLSIDVIGGVLLIAIGVLYISRFIYKKDDK